MLSVKATSFFVLTVTLSRDGFDQLLFEYSRVILIVTANKTLCASLDSFGALARRVLVSCLHRTNERLISISTVFGIVYDLPDVPGSEILIYFGFDLSSSLYENAYPDYLAFVSCALAHPRYRHRSRRASVVSALRVAPADLAI